MTRRRKLKPKERAAIMGDYQDSLKVKVILSPTASAGRW